MAGRYVEKVKAILGEDIWQMLKRSVGKGEVDARRMQDIAYKLHEEVGGGHSRRMGPGMKGIPDWFEFREILGHWYQLELCEFEENRGAAVEKLATIFKSEEVELLNLSTRLQHILPGIFKRRMLIVEGSGNALKCKKLVISKEVVDVCRSETVEK